MIEQEKLNSQEEVGYHLQQDEEYGLPEADYSPLEQEQPEAVEPEPIHSKRAIDLKPEQKQSYAGLWVALIVLVAVAGFAVYYFIFNQTEEVVTPVVVEAPAPVVAPEPEVVEEAPVVEEWTPAAPKEGSVTTISEKTGRYYVVVGSFIDGDMAGDYAQKLAADGSEVTLIEPTGDRKFYRLGIAGGETFEDVATQLDNLKSTFGQDIWIVRY